MVRRPSFVRCGLADRILRREGHFGEEEQIR